MIKSIKKLFSVDISELDFDEMEQDDITKDSLYQQELESNKNTKQTTSVVKEKKTEPFSENKYSEVSVSYEKKPEKKPEILKQYHEDIAPLLAEDSVDDSKKTIRRSFDFEKDIDLSYQQPTTIKKIVEEGPVKENIRQNEKDLVNKDNYVLKDIISPMRGVVRKETNIIKKDNEHKKAQIIKLREEVKAKQVDDDQYIDTVELPFEADTKDLEGSLNSFTFESEMNSTLSETSRFTLIEDSTGKLSLAIDEEDEEIDNK